MKLKPMRCEQAGRFRLEVSGGKRGYKDFGWQDNLILDAGIQRLLGTNGSVLQYISVGAGSTAPAVGQTQLASKIAHTNRSLSFQNGYDSEGGYGWTKFTVQFDKGAAQGNVAELGVGWDGTNLWSRALVLNAQNEPTAITILADEYLTVTYELRSWWIVPENHYVDVMEDVGGTPTVIETVEVVYGKKWIPIGAGAALYVRAHQPILGGVWGGLSAGAVGFSKTIGVSQENGGVSRLDSFGASGGSILGQTIPQLIYGSGNLSLCGFTPPIPKTNEYEVTITGTLTMGRKA